MKGILCSDWLPQWARWAYLACFLPAKAKFFGVIFSPYIKFFIDLAYWVKMAGYWPCSIFVCLFVELFFFKKNNS